MTEITVQIEEVGLVNLYANCNLTAMDDLFEIEVGPIIWDRFSFGRIQNRAIKEYVESYRDELTEFFREKYSDLSIQRN